MPLNGFFCSNQTVNSSTVPEICDESAAFVFADISSSTFFLACILIGRGLLLGSAGLASRNQKLMFSADNFPKPEKSNNAPPVREITWLPSWGKRFSSPFQRASRRWSGLPSIAPRSQPGPLTQALPMPSGPPAAIPQILQAFSVDFVVALLEIDLRAAVEFDQIRLQIYKPDARPCP